MNKVLFPKKDYVKELVRFFKSSKNSQKLIKTLSKYHEKDIAEAITLLTPAERQNIYNVLDEHLIAEIFSYLDDAEKYLEELSLEKAARVVSYMDSDDAVDVLDDLSESKKNEIVEHLDADAKEDVQKLLSYENDEIGSCMTNNFICIPDNLTIREAMSALVKQAGEHDNISTIYVVNSADKFADYEEDSIPVLTDDGKICGILTATDIVELVDDAMGDDYAKLAGLTSEDDLSEPTLVSIKKRLPWLIILLFLGMAVSSVVGIFESVVAVLPIVICFQSLVLDMAGNVGTQSLAVTIRVLMDETLSAKKKLSLLFKEMKIGFINGASLGIMALVFLGFYIHIFKKYAWMSAFLISGCVGLSLIVAMVVSSLVGTIIPMFFHKIHIDPAVASGPLITTVNDLVAVVTYYGLAMIFLVEIFHV